MNKLLEKRDAIYGLCTIWIILFHVFRRISMPYIPVVTNIIGIGNMAVDVFFFFSGLCLCLSAEKHRYLENGWKDYFKKRFARVLLPYAIICIPFYIWSAIAESSGGRMQRVLKFAGDLSSVSFWANGKQTTWFVYGILLLYVLFPLIYSTARRKSIILDAAVLAGTAGFAILASYVPVLKNGLVVWARIPIFSAGVMVGFLDSERSPRKGEIAAAAAVLLVLGTITSLSELSETFTVRQVFRLLLYFPMTLALLTILKEVQCNGKLLRTIGTISLEVYLIHVTLLHPIKHYGMMDAVGYWLYILLPVIAVLLGLMVRKLEERIRKMRFFRTETE